MVLPTDSEAHGRTFPVPVAALSVRQGFRATIRLHLNPDLLAHPTGFEPVTSAFGGQHSIQLSYGCVVRPISTATVRRKPHEDWGSPSQSNLAVNSGRTMGACAFRGGVSRDMTYSQIANCSSLRYPKPKLSTVILALATDQNDEREHIASFSAKKVPAKH